MERFYKRKVDLVISQDEQVLMRKKDKVNNQEAKDISFTRMISPGSATEWERNKFLLYKESKVINYQSRI